MAQSDDDDAPIHSGRFDRDIAGQTNAAKISRGGSMDFFLACPACGHSVSQHSADGCYGNNLACACTEERERIWNAAEHRENVAAGLSFDDATAVEPA
jgi:hypothetical protein